MSDLYVQDSGLSTGTTTAVAVLTGVTAGNTLIAFFGDGTTSAPATFTVSDLQGSYTVQPTSFADALNGVLVSGFKLENANAGTHTATGTADLANNVVLILVEVGAGGVVVGMNALLNSSPGTVNDAITSVTVTGIAAAATLLAFCATTSDVNHTANAGTSFTPRNTGTGSSIGAWRLESQAVAANAAGTFTATAGNGGDNYGSIAIAIANAAAGSGAATQPFIDPRLYPIEESQAVGLMPDVGTPIARALYNAYRAIPYIMGPQSVVAIVNAGDGSAAGDASGTTAAGSQSITLATPVFIDPRTITLGRKFDTPLARAQIIAPWILAQTASTAAATNAGDGKADGSAAATTAAGAATQSAAASSSGSAAATTAAGASSVKADALSNGSAAATTATGVSIASAVASSTGSAATTTAVGASGAKADAQSAGSAASTTATGAAGASADATSSGSAASTTANSPGAGAADASATGSAAATTAAGAARASGDASSSGSAAATTGTGASVASGAASSSGSAASTTANGANATTVSSGAASSDGSAASTTATGAARQAANASSDGSASSTVADNSQPIAPIIATAANVVPDGGGAVGNRRLANRKQRKQRIEAATMRDLIELERMGVLDIIEEELG